MHAFQQGISETGENKTQRVKEGQAVLKTGLQKQIHQLFRVLWLHKIKSMEKGLGEKFGQKGTKLLQGVMPGGEVLNVTLAAFLLAVGDGDDGRPSPCQADIAVTLKINEGLARCVDGNIKLPTYFFNGWKGVPFPVKAKADFIGVMFIDNLIELLCIFQGIHPLSLVYNTYSTIYSRKMP